MPTKHCLVVLRTMRLPFLVLTPVSVFLGICTALYVGAPIYAADVLLVLVGATTAHISVNMLNEYEDFNSGLDEKTAKTPFSGGSGGLPEQPESADVVYRVALGALCITLMIGGYFIYRHGWALLPIGLMGAVIIVAYTYWINRLPWLCLIAPGLGFGPLMVVGTHYAMSGEYSLIALYASLVPFLLTNNLLLLNQFPDLEADASVGRRHFPIVYGTKSSTYLYAVLALCTCVLIILGVVLEVLPIISYISLLPVMASWIVFWGAMTHSTNIEKLIPYLGINVMTAIFTPLMMGFTLLVK